MNIIDIIFVAVVLVLAVSGFSSGAIRMALFLLAWYISVVLSSLYFQALGNMLNNQFGASIIVADAAGFSLLLLLSFTVLALGISFIFRHIRLPRRLVALDQMLGLSFGLILALLVIGVFTQVLQYVTISADIQANSEPWFNWLVTSAEDSRLTTYVANNVIPDVYAYVDPVLPESASMLFIREPR
ncbi:MAG: CvpA family protein [Chloroflexaceae bacterium]|nr:CvpA family protein [Chloroflexaceae bacterium]